MTDIWHHGKFLAIALASAGIATWSTFAVGLYFDHREDARQRAMLCQAAQANRQVLRDIVGLVDPGPFRTRAEEILSRRIPCHN